MGREIERKFLVNENWPKYLNNIAIRQGYISTDPEHAVRIRITDTNATLTIKGRISDMTRSEFEYPIPMEDANEMLENNCQFPLIEKIRHFFKDGPVTWEIDEFFGENGGLIVAEIELEAEDQKFELPDWVGDEVTGDPKYLNINLVQNPFKKWKAGN